MAILLWSRRQILTAAGTAAAGGKLRVSTANTTTLASTYSDAALATPLTNPVVADSLGILPAIFVADSGNFDIAEMTSGNVVLRTTDDVPALGSDASTFLKDFTNSRFQVRGSGGTIYLEAGDADPDDTGGTGVLGGWDNTTADSWTVNATTFNSSVAGSIKENSKKLFGVVYTEATTFSAVSSVDITIPNTPTGVRGYELEVWDFSQSGNGNLQLRTSHDGGGTYKSGASDYVFTWGSFLTGTGASVNVKSTGSAVGLSSNQNGGSNQPGRILMRIITPNSGNDATVISWRADGVINTGEIQIFEGVAWAGATYGRTTNVRLLMSASTMTGKYLVRPLRGFGE